MTTERKNITQPQAWWVAFEAAAKKAGVSLSEWVGNACLDALSESTAEKLPERQGVGRPTLSD